MFARAGYNVSLYDINAKQIDDALVSIKDQLTGLAAVGKSSFFSPDDFFNQDVRGILHLQKNDVMTAVFRPRCASKPCSALKHAAYLVVQRRVEQARCAMRGKLW